MAADPGDISLFSDAAATPVRPEELVAFRYCSYDVPFWVRPNTRAGRWHLVGDEPTQYWSLTPVGAWAELIRYEDLTSESELDDVRMPIWVCRVPHTGIADLNEESLRDAYGVTPDNLTAEDWTACQQAGARIRADFRGVIAPSAALRGVMNLTLFGARRLIDLERRPALASAVPGAIVAIGRPPHGLVQHVEMRTVYPTLF